MNKTIIYMNNVGRGSTVVSTAKQMKTKNQQQYSSVSIQIGRGAFECFVWIGVDQTWWWGWFF